MGSLVAAFGFFFLPLLEIKPNRLASGITINLFEIQGDYRYLALFILALVPLAIASNRQRLQRGWSLVAVGNLLIILTLLLPASAAAHLLDGAEALFSEGTRISNPRIFTSGAMAFGLLGGYIVLFGGLRDLVAEKVGVGQRIFASFSGVVIVVWMLTSGTFDIYSIMVEFSQRGSTLGRRFIEHLVFVLVSLSAGLVIGIALGLWAARDERMGKIILYVVGIIQTIPSLALFGVLLVPLARLGDQAFTDMIAFLGVMLGLAIVVLLALSQIGKRIPNVLKPFALISAFMIAFIPLSLGGILFVAFVFRSVLNVFVNPALNQGLLMVVMGYMVALLTIALAHSFDHPKTVRWLRYARYGLVAVSTVLFAYLLFRGGSQVIGTRTLNNLTLRDLGVSGIGTAPAIIALTLYSLLPLVRNTYAGLNNVDPAVIDSGRGMGMTSPQIFFQIELPLAFPIIMAGVRNAGISLVGIAAVASIIGAGALGDFILLGVNSTSVDLILLGAIPAIILAVMLDVLLQVIEALFTSPGIRRSQT